MRNSTLYYTLANKNQTPLVVLEVGFRGRFSLFLSMITKELENVVSFDQNPCFYRNELTNDSEFQRFRPSNY